MGKDWNDLINNSDLMVANNGEGTYIPRGYGRTTTPDVTLHHINMHKNIKWNVGPPLGSDHLPIIIDIDVKSSPKRKSKKTTKLSYKKANWNFFQEESNRQLTLNDIKTDDNVHISYKKWQTSI